MDLRNSDSLWFYVSYRAISNITRNLSEIRVLWTYFQTYRFQNLVML